MIFDFVFIVTLAAIAYSLISRLAQEKFVDKKSLEEMQLKNKKLDQEYNEAKKRNDKTKMDEITQKRVELLPEMSKSMVGQFKVLGAVLLVFFAFSWGINNFDPNTKDDITISLKDDGAGCDSAVDGLFSACYKADAARSGDWSAHVQAFSGNQKVSERILYFSIDGGQPMSKPSGDLNASIDREAYRAGDVVKITAKSDKADSFKAVLDNGTSFYVNLPFSIPVFNISRINGSSTWFIAVAIVSGLAISLILSIAKRKLK